jgi:hypothetical protein
MEGDGVPELIAEVTLTNCQPARFDLEIWHAICPIEINHWGFRDDTFSLARLDQLVSFFLFARTIDRSA